MQNWNNYTVIQFGQQEKEQKGWQKKEKPAAQNHWQIFDYVHPCIPLVYS